MDTIMAPWRMTFIKGEKPDGCIFCKDSIRSDEFILFEGKTSFIMMNRYPYTCGHLMIIPERHVSVLEDLTASESNEIFRLAGISVKILKDVMQPDGFNVGMNLGKAAGAGVDDHIHMHIVPRWNGDTNFISVVGELRVIPEDVNKTWERLVPLFRNIV
ncbi:MAG: HIT domain-containing protein [Deltaproteobacteria bacterium]|nr:HIT domain-containing protein [Deltaproteobacteria bacterium]